MPEEYREMFQFGIDDEGIHLNDILANCERVFETSVRSGRTYSLINYSKLFINRSSTFYQSINSRCGYHLIDQ